MNDVMICKTSSCVSSLGEKQLKNKQECYKVEISYLSQLIVK